MLTLIIVNCAIGNLDNSLIAILLFNPLFYFPDIDSIYFRWITWCIGICEINASGEWFLKASVRSMHTAKHWNGSSAFNHHRLPSSGLSAESNISSKWFSTNVTRPSWDNLSTPPAYRFAKWIFSQHKPDFPRGRPSANSNMPRHISEPRWFRCGCIGYARPRKSRLWG